MADEWYRSRTWNPDEFERRLSRARPYSRPQYVRIQGLTLLESGGRENRRAAIELFERLMAWPDADFEANIAPEYLADAYAADGQHERAADLYAEAVARQAAKPNVRGLAPFRLADVVLRYRLTDRYRPTLNLFTCPDFDWGGMNWHRFERAKAIALLADRLDEPDLAREAASEAVRLAESETAPEFPRHPTVGLIGADEKTLTTLKQIARGRRNAS